MCYKDEVEGGKEMAKDKIPAGLLPGLSTSFEVGIPTGKVGGSLLFKRRRSEFSRGSGGMPPPKKF